MKKVLIVSPHFAPVNAADMQRVRLVLPHLRGEGWEPVVLALAPESVEGAVLDPLLEETYPHDIRVVRVKGIPPSRTRWMGVGNLWWRCGRALTQAGAELLGGERFDLVFFSTTQFSAFTLGPRWRAQFGVPYVLDYQDPWVNDYYARTGTRPPGGPMKFALSQWSAKRAEPGVLREAGGVIAVSAAYAETLARQYPWFDASRVRVVPFGASERDFEVAEGHRPARPLIDFDDGNVHHVYTGRGGADMAVALTILLRAFRRYRESHPADAARLRFHFIGSGYAPPPLGEDTVMPIAQAEHVAGVVHEHRYRVPYFEALHYLRHAHALVSVGSADATYAPSKIFPYLVARRPLLLVYRDDSPALRLAHEAGAGVTAGFKAASDIDAVAADVHQRWFVEQAWARPTALDPAALAPYTAPALTAQLARVFDEATAAPSAAR